MEKLLTRKMYKEVKKYDREFESKLDNAIKHCEDVISSLDDNCDCKKEHEFLLEILLERKDAHNS